jgi:hypothetical protein
MKDYRVSLQKKLFINRILKQERIKRRLTLIASTIILQSFLDKGAA